MTNNKPTSTSKRRFAWTPCILRSEDGEEQQVSAYLPIDLVTRQQKG